MSTESYIAFLEEHAAVLKRLLTEVANSGVELHDRRNGYAIVQIDSDLWDDDLAPYRTSPHMPAFRPAPEAQP